MTEIEEMLAERPTRSDGTQFRGDVFDAPSQKLNVADGTYDPNRTDDDDPYIQLVRSVSPGDSDEGESDDSDVEDADELVARDESGRHFTDREESGAEDGADDFDDDVDIFAGDPLEVEGDPESVRSRRPAGGDDDRTGEPVRIDFVDTQ